MNSNGGPRQSGRVRVRALQSGASAVEFAIIFPLMAIMMYSTIVYSYVYVLQQSLNFAAQQGAQAAVAVIPSGNTYTQQVAQATATAQYTLNWIPNAATLISYPANGPNCLAAPAGVTAFPFEIDLDLSTMFPSLAVLPGTNLSFPVLPSKLYACNVAFD